MSLWNALTAEQQAVLQSNAASLADLFTFYFASGTKWWTSGDIDLSYGGTTWVANGPILSRAFFRQTLGMEVPTMDLTLDPAGQTVNSTDMLLAALAGAFDGIRVQIHRAYMLTPGVIPNGGPILRFDGNVAIVRPGSTRIQITVEGISAKLNEQLPRRPFTAQCCYRFGDANTCGFNLATVTSSPTLAGGSTTSVVKLNATQANNYWFLGTITVNGETRSVVASADLGGGVHAVTLAAPLSTTPSGAVSITRGCDHTRGACTGYGNIANYGGVPDADTAEAGG